ncbi:riboflavin synthase [Brevibacillus dissolubilis]|uniref:riboflavin synthase n=1 Tax=Brevibacillus dissolubilis TaxID=1844116 RepID=UPI001117276B|nr:riboflavin synthase [Brevibacillus dissolubilis]
MFTGIIEEVGTIAGVEGGSQASKVLIQAKTVLGGVQLGDSISVNGVCLTVTSFTASHFTADVMPETLKKTNLGKLKRGEPVNLERAMAMGDRFGGHIVSGHVDGVGQIISRENYANAVLFRITAPKSLQKYMIPRGSVTVDGISLTLVDVENDGFSISIIPHTLAHTCLRDKHAGDMVNLECDVIGKYVERLMTFGTEGSEGSSRRSSVSLDFLRDNGFA